MKKHVFTGVFIPAKIWLSKDLNPQKKMILAEIKALSEDSGWCYANNGHFAEWLGTEPQNASKYIQQLHRDGLIEITYMDEKTFAGRKMRVNLEWYYGENDPSTVSRTPSTVSRTPSTVSRTPSTVSRTEIQSKYTLKEEEEDTRENGISQLEEKPLLANEGSAAPAQKPAPADTPLTYDQRPYPKDAADLREKLRNYFTANPTQWTDAVLEMGKASKWPAQKIIDTVVNFCLHKQKTSDFQRTYHEYTADLTQWFIRQGEYDARDSAKPSASKQSDQNTTFIPTNIPVFR